MSGEWLRFPKLRLLIEQVALDNGMHMKDSPKWPDGAPQLEELAKGLSKDEVELLAMGERSDAEVLIKAKGLQTLNKFLNEVFDGDLTKDFFLAGRSSI